MRLSGCKGCSSPRPPLLPPPPARYGGTWLEPHPALGLGDRTPTQPWDWGTGPPPSPGIGGQGSCPVLRLGAAVGHIPVPALEDEVWGHQCRVHPVTHSLPGRSAILHGKLSHGRRLAVPEAGSPRKSHRGVRPCQPGARRARGCCHSPGGGPRVGRGALGVGRAMLADGSPLAGRGARESKQ